MTGAKRDSHKPLVSAIITTYNRPAHLEKAIESVLDQTYPNIELVIVDDHSDQPAADAVADIDLRLLTGYECVRHEENRGVNAARNTGIETATGEFVAFLDDDDQWAPEKLERQVNAFMEGEEIGVVFTGVEKRLPGETSITIPPAVDGDITKELLCRNVVGSMSVVMVRADIAQAVPLDERFPCWADLEWYINLSTETRFKRLPEPLVTYECDSPGRLSRDFEKESRGYELFVDEFDSLAGEYGPLFRRKMHGWAAFRAGKGAFHSGYYSQARHLFATALTSYPFEPEFHQFFLASLGGQPTHKFARLVKQVASW